METTRFRAGRVRILIHVPTMRTLPPLPGGDRSNAVGKKDCVYEWGSCSPIGFMKTRRKEANFSIQNAESPMGTFQERKIVVLK